MSLWRQGFAFDDRLNCAQTVSKKSECLSGEYLSWEYFEVGTTKENVATGPLQKGTWEPQRKYRPEIKGYYCVAVKLSRFWYICLTRNIDCFTSTLYQS